MTNNAVAVLRVLFGIVWRLFTSWYFPGTNITPAAFFVFIIIAGAGLKFFLGLATHTYSGGGRSISKIASRSSNDTK